MSTVPFAETPTGLSGPTQPIRPEQSVAAKIVGFLYLFTMATAIFAQLYVHSRLVVPSDAVQTATNIVASERLFRIGIVSDLITGIGVVVLIWALYVVLEPIDRRMALLAVFLRITEGAIAGAALISTLMTLRFLSGPRYLDAFETAQLQVLARLTISTHGAGLQIAFVFLGLGSTVFSILWLRSGYIPRVLAAWGIFASLVLALVGMAVILFPALGDVLGMSYMAPMFIYEVGLGIWLLFKRLRAPIEKGH